MEWIGRALTWWLKSDILILSLFCKFLWVGLGGSFYFFLQSCMADCLHSRFWCAPIIAQGHNPWKPRSMLLGAEESIMMIWNQSDLPKHACMYSATFQAILFFVVFNKFAEMRSSQHVILSQKSIWLALLRLLTEIINNSCMIIGLSLIHIWRCRRRG